MYARYLKQLVGWKRAADTRFNTRFLLQQMRECGTLFTSTNLLLDDLSNSETIVPSASR